MSCLTLFFVLVISTFSDINSTVKTIPGEVDIQWQLTKLGTSDKKGNFKISPKTLVRMSKHNKEIKLLFQKSGYFKKYKVHSLKQTLDIELAPLFDFFDFIEIPAGNFTMGRQDSEYNNSFEKPQHKVTISKPFYIGKFEVSQKQWKAIFHRSNSHVKRDDLPVENVSWVHVQKFLIKLNKMADCSTPNTVQTIQKSGIEAVASGCYRLPTEAEWEYAARGGTKTAFSFGDMILAKDANFDVKKPYSIKGLTIPILSPKERYLLPFTTLKSMPSGQFKPNAFGLYDMHGNVSEWVFDWFDPKFYTNGDVTDPVNTKKSNSKVLRGGGWDSWGRSLRSASRFDLSPKYKSKSIGFRLVFVK